MNSFVSESEIGQLRIADARGLSDKAVESYIIDVYELFVNGASLGTKSDINMNNYWAGADGGTGLGQEGGTQRYDGTTLFDSTNMAVFTDGDDNDITVNIYDQTLPDYDLNDILVPEPSTALLSGLGLLAMVLRRRRQRSLTAPQASSPGYSACKSRS
jgi:hypothetical protein